jgi:hypothetical protein
VVTIPEPFRSILARAKRDRIVMGTVTSIEGHRQSASNISREELAARYEGKVAEIMAQSEIAPDRLTDSLFGERARAQTLEELAGRHLGKSWAANYHEIPADATFDAANWEPGQERPAWHHIDLACRVLGRLAGAATPGPWQEAFDDHGPKHGTNSGVWSDGPRRYVVETAKPGNPNYVADARYIAMVDPMFTERVLALLRSVQDMSVEQRPHAKSEMDVVLAAINVAKKIVDESGYPHRQGDA